MKLFSLFISLITLSISGLAQTKYKKAPATSFSPLLHLTDATEGILQEASGYDGRLDLVSKKQADLMLGLGKIQRDRDVLANSIIDPKNAEKAPCKTKEENPYDTHQKSTMNYADPCGPRVPGSRKWRFGFLSQLSLRKGYGGKKFYKTQKFNPAHNYMAAYYASKTKYMSPEKAAAYIIQNHVPKNKDGIHLNPQDQRSLTDSIVFKRLQKASPKNRKEILKRYGMKTKFQEQMDFMAKVGKEFSSVYDFNREKEALRATGSVDCDALFTAVNNSTKDGVCRDMVICQAKMLGMINPKLKKHAYGVSFATPSSYHVSLIVTNPDDGSVHKVNYNEVVKEDKKSGAAAIDQSSSLPNIGTTFRFWDEDGRIVNSLPEEKYQLITKIMGMNPQEEFDPFIEENYKVHSAYANYGPIQGNVFMGHLSNGDKVVGTALNLKWARCKKFKNSRFKLATRGNLGVGYTQHDIKTYAKDKSHEAARDINLRNVYMVLNGEVYAPIKVTPRVTVEPSVGGRLGATLAITEENNKFDEEGNPLVRMTGDGEGLLDLGLKVKAENKKGDMKVQAGVRSQLSLGLSDFRPLLGSKGVLYPNMTELSLGVNKVLTGSKDDPKIVLFTNSLLALRKPGHHLMLSQGIDFHHKTKKSKNKTTVQSQVTTPVGRLKQAWLPGGSHTRVGSGVTHVLQRVDKDGNPKAEFNFGLRYLFVKDPRKPASAHSAQATVGVEF